MSDHAMAPDRVTGSYGGGAEVFAAMLDSWRESRRHLTTKTVDKGVRVVRDFATTTGAAPWRWTRADAKRYYAALYAHGRSDSTVGNYRSHLHAFQAFISDPQTVWPQHCRAEFGRAPRQVFHETPARPRDDLWTPAPPTLPTKRAFSTDELAALFAYANDLPRVMRAHGSKGVPAAERNATLIAVALVFGLLSHEVLALKIGDFDTSEQAPEYGPFALCQIRDHRVPIDPPLIRSAPALPGHEYIAEDISHWIHHLRPQLPHAADTDNLWPSEHGPRLAPTTLRDSYRRLCQGAGIPEELDFLSLRRTHQLHRAIDG